jgi:CheY-like chemotaxis protein
MNQRLLILVVDDLDKKRQTIIRALGRRLKNYDVVFESADRYEAALEKLRVRNYDFVILDVKIPAGNEPASEKWSRYLLDQITEGSTRKSPISSVNITSRIFSAFSYLTGSRRRGRSESYQKLNIWQMLFGTALHTA